MTKRALILGIGGMDGSHLADLLLEKGYCVHGLYRRSSSDNLWRIRHLLGPPAKVQLHQGDLCDPLSVRRVICDVYPDELYNMADQDHVGWSQATPGYSVQVTAGAVSDLLEVVRQTGPSIRVFQPVSATMFGMAPPPQNELTPLDPRSPYACAKAHAYHLCRHYRRDHGLYVACGIMFNHDSVRRGPDYLLHRICRQAAAGGPVVLRGDLNLRVDVGHAPDYVEAAWRMLQQDEPDDFVIGTGSAWTIRELANQALHCANAGRPGSVNAEPGDFRHGREPTLIADAEKARRALRWEPTCGVGFVIARLVEHYQRKGLTL